MRINNMITYHHSVSCSSVIVHIIYWQHTLWRRQSNEPPLVYFLNDARFSTLRTHRILSGMVLSIYEVVKLRTNGRNNSQRS